LLKVKERIVLEVLVDDGDPELAPVAIGDGRRGFSTGGSPARCGKLTRLPDSSAATGS
jgi:hypothetical protein